MWTTDLLLAARRLRRRPAYAALNVGGLAVGLACCLLITLFVRDELSFDRSHPEADRLYRVERDVRAGSSSGPEMQRWASAELPVADDVLPRVPGVEGSVRITQRGAPLVVRGEARFYEDRFLYAEPALFELFDAEVVRGSAADLARPFTVVLSEPTAARYFGDADPLGRTLDVVGRFDRDVETYEVVGVMREMPHNVHVHADFVASFASAVPTERRWSRTAFTYVRLGEGAEPGAVEGRLGAAYARARPEAERGVPSALALTPVADLHLRGTAEGDLEPQGDVRYVWLFSAIAVVVLLIAGVNYVNLATARGARRAREIGVRRAVGAGRGGLVRLVLAESLVVTAAAVAVGVGLAALALPAFGAWMGRPLALPLGEPWLWAALAGAAVALGVGAGAYPALVLSAVRPTSALAGRGGVASRTTLRKALVVVQFTATVALIACAVGIQRQLHFVQHTRLGFEPDRVLVLRTRGALGERGAAFARAAEAVPGVRRVALGSGVPGEPTAVSFFDPADVEGQGAEGGPVVFDAFWVGDGFVPALGMEVVEGRGLGRASDAGRAALVNETAARRLGWAEPLGKTVGAGEERREVVGVLRDFHVADMREEIGPVLVQYDPGGAAYAVVQLGAGDLPATLAAVEAAWDTFAPDQLFDAFFLDSHVAAMYRAERLVGQVFLAFSALAVVVACLGLFGLAMLTAEQRTKEIGIRKALGASVGSLVALLSRESAALVAVAFVVAVPLAYGFLQDWLSAFAYRAEPTAGLFLGAGLLTLAVAVATVAVHALRVATADPTRALRSE